MGYRTEGKWVITGPVDHITAAWVKCRLIVVNPSTEDLWSEFDLFRVKNDAYIRFSFEDWKWYESNKEIQFFESIWSALEEYADENDGTISGGRVHIGEDGATDSQEFGDSPLMLYSSTNFVDEEPSEGEPLTTP